jgi:hypothetical protein
MGGEMISFTLRIGSTAVLARLLIPEDFGLIGMVVALTGFAKIFKDLGLSDATIQHKDITHEKVSTLFWINVLVGFLIMIIIAALSPLIAWFYNDPRLIGISLTTSTAFLFSGLTVQHQALICAGLERSVNISIHGCGFLAHVQVAARFAKAWKRSGFDAEIWERHYRIQCHQLFFSQPRQDPDREIQWPETFGIIWESIPTYGNAREPNSISDIACEYVCAELFAERTC